MVLKAPGNRVLGMSIFPIMTRDANGSPILHTFDSKKEKKKTSLHNLISDRGLNDKFTNYS